MDSNFPKDSVTCVLTFGSYGRLLTKTLLKSFLCPSVRYQLLYSFQVFWVIQEKISNSASLPIDSSYSKARTISKSSRLNRLWQVKHMNWIWSLGSLCPFYLSRDVTVLFKDADIWLSQKTPTLLLESWRFRVQV